MQGGDLLPYGATNLVFKDGNETTETQEEYYAFLNHYIKEHNIPGVYYEKDEDMLPTLDKITDMITDLIRERVYIEAGTLVNGEMAESDTVTIRMDEENALSVRKSKKK